MTMCADCSLIKTNCRFLPNGHFAEGHDGLRKTRISGYRPHAQAAVNITYYTCRHCATQWQHENDGGDAFVGWSLDCEAQS